MSGNPTLERIARGNGLALCAAGPWIARFAASLEAIVADAEKLAGSRPNIFIDVSQVASLDTFGARFLRIVPAAPISVTLSAWLLPVMIRRASGTYHFASPAVDRPSRVEFARRIEGPRSHGAWGYPSFLLTHPERPGTPPATDPVTIALPPGSTVVC